MTTLLHALLQFVLSATDPRWTCELAHREPDVAATYYLYCAQMLPDGTELATVGKFMPDVAR